MQGKRTAVNEQSAWCPTHGVMMAKDVMTMYPEGHKH